MNTQPTEEAEIDANEQLTERELRALQLERLKASLAHAYANNPNYRQKFDAAGFIPDDLKSPVDLERLPFTTKEDLRAAYGILTWQDDTWEADIRRVIYDIKAVLKQIKTSGIPNVDKRIKILTEARY